MSLFRYPGGKTRYTDFILPTLYRCSGFSIYVEPFVGGGSVALAVAERHPNVKLILNDLDKGIWAFWDLGRCNAPEDRVSRMADRILHTRPWVALFKEIHTKPAHGSARTGVRAFFLNRASHMGMGQRALGGKGQTSKGKIDSRWGASVLSHK